MSGIIFGDRVYERDDLPPRVAEFLDKRNQQIAALKKKKEIKVTVLPYNDEHEKHRLSVRPRCTSLGEHLKAFMNHYNKNGFEKDAAELEADKRNIVAVEKEAFELDALLQDLFAEIENRDKLTLAEYSRYCGIVNKVSLGKVTIDTASRLISKAYGYDDYDSFIILFNLAGCVMNNQKIQKVKYGK